VHQGGFSLNEYIEMHGHQNKKLECFLIFMILHQLTVSNM